MDSINKNSTIRQKLLRETMNGSIKVFETSYHPGEIQAYYALIDQK